ncbi:MAG: preprotein translocase subunit SecA [Acidimicrobiia bacterium]
MSLIQKVLHAGEGRRLKAVVAIVPEINALEPEVERLSDEQLRGRTNEFRERIDQARTSGKNPEHGEELVADLLHDLLPDAFATVREAGRRVLGQRHFDVQLMGGAALHLGWVAEMKTGEGKTLVATLPSYLNGLAGRGVHLVTVNDYLASRDADWMGELHRFLGLTVGKIIPDDSLPEQKRAMYGCDITYGTNNEFGFDYLRDNMVTSIEDQVQRGARQQSLSPHYFAIVDEVDSILIDEARTPLIISGRATDAAELYYQFARIVRGLHRERDYEVDEAKRTVVPTEEGIGRVEEALGVENLYEHVNQNYVHQIQQALKAKELFKRDVDYLVTGGEVHIVDEFTGRILEGRRWSEGLHQAVEAKEGVHIKEENQTLATVTLQNYFRQYNKLSGMTGTANTEAGEFAHTYDLQVVSIPTNQAMIRIDNADYIYKTEDAKYEAATKDIAERHENGQPVLVGTISVEKSEKLSRLLEKRGIPHEVLNAKQHEREAEIVTQAGQLSAVTVATNMAGRGVDILLGGNPEGLARRECMREGLAVGTPEYEARYTEVLPRFKDECKVERDKVLTGGGLYVLGTERHESRRIDNQLRGRSGRQGDPGESRFYLSLEDELMRLFATGLMQRVMDKSFEDDVPLESKMVSKAVERAQGTVEDRNFEIRKDVLKYDEVMNEQRKIIYRRRQQILDGEDLRDAALDAIESTIGSLVNQYCGSEFAEEWNTEGLLDDARTHFPTRVTKEQLDVAGDSQAMEELLHDDATALYAEKEESIGAETLRDIERRVMLSVIDQHWREHLYEMDYLQEGINLRAMGQQDPLSEWQREGFDMFEAMMGQIADDFVQYVFHLQVVVDQQPQSAVQNVQYSAPTDPVQGSGAIVPAMASQPELIMGDGDEQFQTTGAAEQPVVQAPVRVEKTPGRNEPCFCGSGKKYKLCHGR